MSETIYTASNETLLNQEIAEINTASATAAPGSSYVIDITSDFGLSSNITAISLAAGTSLEITGNNPSPEGNPTAQLDGNTNHRGFVVLSGAVTLDSLSLINMRASGGNGGNGPAPGGGGAGLGGAVFVGAAAAVTLSNDTFGSNAAAGGAGGVRTGPGTGAGGSGEPGGFGIGGAGGVAGGFGGGGGFGAAGGFGAGSNAGGGLAAGGNIFVQQGGQLTFSSGTATGGTLTASGGGQTYGSNIFIQGNTTITLGNVTLFGVIADQTGSGGLGPNAGAGGILAQGAVTLSGANTYTGGTTIEDSLTLKSAQAAGTGEISFTSGGSLIVGAGDTPANLIGGFVTGDTIDLKGIGLEKTTSLSGSNALTLSGAHAGPVTLNFDPLQNYANDTFILQSDGAGGTLLTVTQTQFTVGSESDLNTALAEIDAGGKYAVPNMAYTITFTASFTLGSDINAINLSSGDTLTINGAGNTVDGGGQYRGLFVYGGQVTLEDLTIQNAVAAGGAGGAGTSGGGGGAGLGGGLFVAAGTSVALDNVSFLNDQAIGGNGGAIAGTGTGGGGGLGGAGGAGNGHSGGGGGVGTGAVGGTYGAGNGGNGILLGTGTGSSGTGSGAGAGGGNGGGGGIAGVFSGSGRDPRSYPGTAGAGGIAGSGNFGGGAGSGQPAGFGGGGAASNGSPYGVASGAGGWGGGGAGGAAGGFGAGAGSTGGGGGLGAGGAVFVQQGGTLTITDGTISGNSAAGGTGSGGGGNGSGYGSGIYFQGNSQLTLAPGTGQTLTVSDVITDTAGVAGTAGQVSLLLNGAGTVTLSAANTYTGGTTLAAGTLSLQAPGAAGGGAITFSYGSTATLIIGSGDVPTNVIGFFLPGETIDLQGIGTATSAVLGAGDVLQVTGGTTNVNLSLYTGQIFTGETFSVATDTHGGTLLTAVTTGNDHPPSIAGVALNGDDHTAFAPLKGVTVSDLDSGQTETATLTLSTTADGKLSNLGGGSYNATTGVYTVTGTAAAVTTALDKLIFTPTNHQVAPGGVVTTGFDLSITDGTMTADTPFSVAVTALNDAPVISGGATQFDGYWNVALKPYAGVKIADPDKSASETVTLTVSGSGTATGTFSLAAPVDGVSLTETSPGVYTLTSASPSAVTAALHAVKFTPGTTNPAIGYTIASLGISVSDGIAPAVAGQGVTVYAGLPIVTGAAAGQSVVDTSTIAPFSHVHITDSAYFTSESVTIILTDSTGASTDANGTLSGTGLTKVGVGTYTLASGTPGAVTTAIEHLIFTPTPNQVPAGQSVTTGFQIAIFDGATTSDNYTTSVIATAPAAAVLNTATIGQPDMAFLTPAEHQAGVQPDNSLAGDKFSLLDLSPHDNQALFGAAPATDAAPAWGTGALLPDHNWPHAGALLGSKSLFSSHYG